MAPARETMQAASAQVPRFMRDVAQVSTFDGAVMAEDETPDLGEALVAPPSWRVVIDTFLRYAVTDVAVLAPSRMLKNILADSLGKNVRVHSLEDDADLDRVAEIFTPAEAAAAG